ncbi:MAG: alpha/beta fold hydrolase [Thiotrichales bacterium]
MQLAYSEFGSEHDGPAIVIAHGLFGSRANWRSIASRLAASRRVFTVDMRNHGESPHSPEMTYEAMSQDLAEFANQYCDDKAFFVGHSMGGKAVMALALSSTVALRFAVLDIAPRKYPSAQHRALIQAMRSIQLDQVEKRSDADLQLEASVPDKGIRQFLLQSLVRDGDRYSWRLNLRALENALETISDFPPCRGSSDASALFVYGTASDYVQEADRDLIRHCFPRAEFVAVEQASHWLHAEQPDLIVQLLQSYQGGA